MNYPIPKQIIVWAIFVLIVGTVSVILISCGASIVPPSSPSNSAPTVSVISPAFAVAGANSQTIKITGSGFVPSSSVLMSGLSHPANFVNSAEIDVPMTQTDLSTPRNYNVVVSNPTPGGGTSSSSVFSVWQPNFDPTTGLHFAAPPFAIAAQINVDTSTAGLSYLKYELQNASGTFVPDFSLTIYDNSSSLSLVQWFEDNVDVSGILLNQGGYSQTTLANGSPCLVFSGTIPDQFYAVGGGPPLDDVYTITSIGQIVSIGQSQTGDLYNQGYSTSDSVLQLELEILGTAHF